MRKKVGIIKRFFTLLLVFLLSINSFAAIVSDNDGSAFITKAEFDALKSNFQAQIDTYNQSIDSKIDGAIASYLSGLAIATQEKREVLALANLDASEDITSQENTSFQYVYSRAKWYVDTFWGSNFWKADCVYCVVGKVGVNIAPDSHSMQRALVEKNASGKYRWSGYATYTTNEKRLHLVNNHPNTDTQFALGDAYTWRMLMPVIHDISGSGQAFVAGDMTGKVKSCLTYQTGYDGNYEATQATLSNNQSYTLTNTHDFIFSNNVTTTPKQVWFDPSTAGTLLCLAPYDRINDYWHTAWDAGTVDTSMRSLFVCIYINRQAYNCGKLKKQATNVNMLDDAPTSLTQWKDIYANDNAKYTYNDGSSTKTISNYPITAGIPIVSLKTDEEFIWDMTFTDDVPKDLYFYYYNPDIDVPTESQCIKVSVNGANPQAINTVAKNAKITYRAEKNGIVFTKWKYQSSSGGGGTLSTANSKMILVTRPN